MDVLLEGAVLPKNSTTSGAGRERKTTIRPRFSVAGHDYTLKELVELHWEEYHRQVTYWIRRRVFRQDQHAELVARVFSRALLAAERNRDRFPNKAAGLSFLKATWARGVLQDHIKEWERNKLHCDIDGPGPEIPADAPTPEEEVERREAEAEERKRKRVVAKIAKTLPPKSRDIFEKIYVLGWTRREYRKRLGLKKATVDDRHLQLVRRIRKALQDRGCIPTTGDDGPCSDVRVRS